jgi:predicted transcriptional regulator
MKQVKLLVESFDDFRRGAIEKARRLDSGDRSPSPAHFSWESGEELLKVITPNRWRLVTTLKRSGPTSIRALAKLLDRDYRGVHADVAALLEAELIAKNEAGAIHVPWSKITIEMDSAIAA